MIPPTSDRRHYGDPGEAKSGRSVTDANLITDLLKMQARVHSSPRIIFDAEALLSNRYALGDACLIEHIESSIN